MEKKMEKMVGVFEYCDGWTCHKYFGEEGLSIKELESHNNYCITNEATYGDTNRLAFAVPFEVAKKAKKFINDIDDSMGDLKAIRTDLFPCREANQKHDLNGLVPGVLIRCQIGHWSGVGDIGLLDDCTIEVAIVQVLEFGTPVTKKCSLWSTESYKNGER